ncbi:MAG: glycoside hydrolase family 32 protein [Pasteurellaceae bacterium]|nr:glycoside hydrolase family 32 protein [Pasteurellaceae bacterium]
MLVFNNGKYKSILAATPNELHQIQTIVAQDQDYRPVYHIAPPTGLLNDPNGLIFDGEKFHLFYQWFPFDALHGMKHWQHLITRDFQDYQSADNLIPDELFESHGCYSGGALLVGDNIAAFYTGNTRRATDNQRVPYQNLAIFDKRGKLLSKRPLLESAPEGYTEHFRDPKPYFTADGKIRFICGAQRNNLTGTALVFEMDNLDDTPRLLGELTLPNFNNANVFMWECPDLLQINGQDLFIWSPQGKARETEQFQNNYHATYALGNLDSLTFNSTQIAELDQGFDFYAPQTFANVKDRTILFGWCGLPDLTYPTDQYKWHSMLTMPRELRVVQGKIYQRPINEIYANLQNEQTVQGQQIQIEQLDQAYIKFDVNNQAFSIDFFTNAQGQKLSLHYANNRLTLVREHTEQTELMRDFGQQRHCHIENLQQIEIFFDRSIVEIFINQGEKAMTSRFFIPQRTNQFSADREIIAHIAYPTPITIK